MAELTRRQLAAALATAVGASTQAAEPAKDDLAVQRDNLKRNLTALEEFRVPVATEPSLIFKA